MLNEIGQRQKLYDITYKWTLKNTTHDECLKKKLTHRYRELVVNSEEKGGTGEGHDRSRGLRGANYYKINKLQGYTV